MKHFTHEPANTKDILNQSLWLNENLKINKNYIYFKEWENKGIHKISHLYNQVGVLFTHDQLTLKYNLKSNFLQTAQIHNAIPKVWKKSIINYNKTIIPNSVDIKININNNYMTLNTIKCKDFYWHLINSKTHIPSNISKWAKYSTNLSTKLDPKWKYIYMLPFQIIKDTRLQTFQYKIINRTISCNKWLNSIKIKDTDICSYCPEEDNINHFFLLCLNCNNFWVYFNTWWHSLTRTHLLDLTLIENLQDCILLGFPNNNNATPALNYCIILAKYYIYNCKINQNNNLDFYTYLVNLKHRLKIEKQITDNIKNTTFFNQLSFIYENI